ncbi:hypothetical protein ACU4GD_08125 [Cupriavidus basilensis]
MVVAYTADPGLSTPASGWLADRFGTRRVCFCGDPDLACSALRSAPARRSLDQLSDAPRGPGHRRLDAAADRPAGGTARRLRRAVHRGPCAALSSVAGAAVSGSIFGDRCWAAGSCKSVAWRWICLIKAAGQAQIGMLAVLCATCQDNTIETARRRSDFIRCGFGSQHYRTVAFSLALGTPRRRQSRGMERRPVRAEPAVRAGAIPHARRRRDHAVPAGVVPREPQLQHLAWRGNLVRRIGSGAVPFLMPPCCRSCRDRTCSPLHFRADVQPRWPRCLSGRQALDRAVGQALWLLDTFLLVDTLLRCRRLDRSSFAARFRRAGRLVLAGLAQLALFGATSFPCSGLP